MGVASKPDDVVVESWSHEEAVLADGVERRLNPLEDSAPLRGQQHAECADYAQAKRVSEPSCGEVIKYHAIRMTLQAEAQGFSFAGASPEPSIWVGCQ